MRFTLSTAAFLAFASSVLAQTANFDVITSPKKDEVVAAGSTYTIIWEPDSKHTGDVTVSLLGGDTPSTLSTVATLKSGVASSAGKYEWAVDSSLGKDKTYGIQITLDSDKKVFQYSFPFHIKAGSGGSSSSTKSSYPTSSDTSSASYTSSVSSSKVYPTTSAYPYGNYSTTATAGPTLVTLTSTAPAGGAGATKTTSGGGSVPTSGAQSLAAGSLALLGGLAAAVFAL